MPIANPIDNIERITAEQHGVTEDLVHTIASFQWSKVRECAVEGKSVEVSSLCYFDIRARAAKKRLFRLNIMRAAYERELETAEQGSRDHQRFTKRLAGCVEEIDFIEARLKELEDE